MSLYALYRVFKNPDDFENNMGLILLLGGFDGVALAIFAIAYK